MEILVLGLAALAETEQHRPSLAPLFIILLEVTGLVMAVQITLAPPVKWQQAQTPQLIEDLEAAVMVVMAAPVLSSSVTQVANAVLAVQ
jgi:hypothetical protein